MLPHEAGRKRAEFSGSGCGHPYSHRLACRVGREIFRPAQDVIILATDTVQAQQDALAELPRLVLESHFQVPLHFADERFERFFQNFPRCLRWFDISPGVTAGATVQVVVVVLE